MPYANPQYLVETNWLEQHLHDANLRIFDVTGMLTSKLENIAKEKCYDTGHIPALFSSMWQALRGSSRNPTPSSRGRGQRRSSLRR